MRGCVLVVVLVGCGVSVNHRPLGPGQFLVEAEGRSRHSHADVLQAAHRDASAVCSGRYRVLDNANSQRNGGYVDPNGAIYIARRLTVVLTIECVQ